MKLSALAFCLMALAQTALSITLEDLSTCARSCLEQGLVSTNCEGQCDGACVCSTAYTGNVMSCVLKCPDVAAVLELQQAQCGGTLATCAPASTSSSPPTPSPSSGGDNCPDPSALSECGRGCLEGALGDAHCSGACDVDCICGTVYQSSATNCIVSKCPGDAVKALALQSKTCPTPSVVPSSTTPPTTSKPPASSTTTKKPDTTTPAGCPDMSKLSTCAQTCLHGALGDAKCSSACDVSCICGSDFVQSATVCIATKCPADAVTVLAMQQSTCSAGTTSAPPASTTSSTPTPPSGNNCPDKSALSACSKSCLDGALVSAKCNGDCDVSCICGTSFVSAATVCIASKCPADAVAVLALQQKTCSGAGSGSSLSGTSSTSVAATTTNSTVSGVKPANATATTKVNSSCTAASCNVSTTPSAVTSVIVTTTAIVVDPATTSKSAARGSRSEMAAALALMAGLVGSTLLLA